MLDIQAIRERCEKATPGPWEVTSFSEDEVHVTVGYKYENGIHSANWIADIHEGEDDTTADERFADAEFISNARTDIPALLDEIERLRGALDAVTYPVNNLSSPDALEYHADVCKTVEEALAGDSHDN